ncbi:PQQ-dependent sugar dehydrogenase [Nocardioides sp. QY071]|uniref:PQQ-dependent sugar dehydrogenase n=1 Tax=Nocardioides sp. QY071 TaxID=3044187 RepID=UPI00249C708C|nr:PQQ-dependent sugar dehydrogenase [Nocardioides sp. QY071]WGX99850.1 PQQ-dependent sugar dehydrogenase [Nocardioides sp. QY071]
MVRALLTSLLVAVVVLQTTGSGAAAPSGSAARPTVSVSPSSPRVGEAVRLRTRLPGDGRRPVRIEESVAGRWVRVARTRTDRRGVARAELVATAGPVRYRFRAPAQRSGGRRLPAAVSRVVTVTGTTTPAPEPLPPPPGVTVAVEGRTITATTTGRADRVRFLVDGVAVAEDPVPPWQADLTAASGTHDVVARAIGRGGSTLSEAVLVDVPAPVIGVDSGVADGFAIETVQGGLSLPTSAAVLPSGAVLVTEKAGLVQAVEPTGEGGFAPPREVLDLRDLVRDEGDAGLTGIAVDPGFTDNGYVYLAHVLADPADPADGTADRHSQQVARYTWDGDALDPSSRTVVLGSVTGPGCWADENVRTPDCLPLRGDAHTIGDLGFDAAGRLLVGIGDGSLYLTSNGVRGRLETLRAQDPQVLAGKVLRIDPATGRGVPSNPAYTGDGSDNASRVLALGLRNPFRFGLQGDLLVIGEVGEGSAEEVDVVDLAASAAAPANFGWPCREGAAATDLGDVDDPESPWHACAAVRADGGARAPSYSYPHATGGGSVTGGTVLADPAYPTGTRGRYVFGDYAQNRIWTAHLAVDGDVTGVEVLADTTAAEGPVKFLTGPDGLVWTLSIYTGSLRRIRPTAAATPDRCPEGSFRRTFHDLDGADSVFDLDLDQVDPAWRWVYPYTAAQLPAEPLAEATCEAGIRLEPTSGSPWAGAEHPDERAHPGDRFGTAWRGRVDLAAGTYRFSVRSGEWVRLWVDDQVVHDFYAGSFWAASRDHDVVLADGLHAVRAELVHGDVANASAEVTWTRTGGPPVVALAAPANGYVAATGEVPFTIAASDPDDPHDPDGTVLADGAELAVDFLHYSGGTFHAHPVQRVDGVLAGTVQVSDLHAPGAGVVRLRATVTDSSGIRSTSAPVYVCFPGAAVGPCAP